MKPRFKSLEEYYKAIDGLSGMLTAEGITEEARRLHELLHEMAWTTSSPSITGDYSN